LKQLLGKKEDISILLRGKATILYGDPGVGKSTTLCHLAGKLHEKTKKPTLMIWSDENLYTSFGENLASLSKAKIFRTKDPQKAIIILRNALNEDLSMAVVDSVTGFEEEIMRREGATSPRVSLIMSRYGRILMYYLAELAHRKNIPAFAVCHAASLFEGDFRGQKDRPAFARRAVKNADAVIYQFLKTVNGARKPFWRIVFYRSLSSNLEGKEFSLEEIIK